MVDIFNFAERKNDGRRWHLYDATETRNLLEEFMKATAQEWEDEAWNEEKKGAANLGMIGALRWGADRLRKVAGRIDSLPKGEYR